MCIGKNTIAVMTSLEQFFSSSDDPTTIKRLKDKNIKSIVDFLQEKPENISKITKLHFKDVLEIRQKILNSFQGNFHAACDLLEEKAKNDFVLASGIQEIDALLGGFKSGITYELCGLSGSGKTHTCLSLAASTAIKEKCVYYIDTKGDFSAFKLKQIISKTHSSKKDIIACLERIRVATVHTLYELISALHWLKNQLLYDNVPLIVIDCLSTAYFLSVGGDKPIGLGLLNHIANLIKYIAIEYHVVVVLTNLATKDFKDDDMLLRRNTKPCLGKYWFHVANYRVNFKKENNVIQVSLEGNSLLANNTICNINLD